MAGGGPDPGTGSARDARLREVVLSQIIWSVGVVAMIAVAVWGVATWSQSLKAGSETSVLQMQQQLEQTRLEMQQRLEETRKLLDGQGALLSAHQSTLAKLVDFMESQTTARRAVGERESYRKQLCARGSLDPALCQSLPSDDEIEALRR